VATYPDGLFVRKQSPIQVVIGPSVEQSQHENHALKVFAKNHQRVDHVQRAQLPPATNERNNERSNQPNKQPINMPDYNTSWRAQEIDLLV